MPQRPSLSDVELSAIEDRIIQSLPKGLSDDEVNARVYAGMEAAHADRFSGATPQSTPAKPSDSGALLMAGAGAAVPAVAHGAMEIATSPTLAKTGGTIGRILGAAAPPVAGLIEGGPVGMLAGLLGASKGSWLGGHTGYFSGRLLQDAAAPVSRVLNAVGPYTQALRTGSGAQGVLDLAQMAEPKRRDIGVMGVGTSPTAEQMHMTPDAFADYQRQHPPFLNSLASKIAVKVRMLMQHGLSQDAAVKAAAVGLPR